MRFQQIHAEGVAVVAQKRTEGRTDGEHWRWGSGAGSAIEQWHERAHKWR